MKIEQHYLLNLKRRPERLFTWVGAQDQMDFDFSKLTVFEAIDGKNFANTREIAVYAAQLGFKYLLDRVNEDEDIASRGILARNVSALVMLKQIAESESDGYTVTWEDDVILKIPYDAFKRLSVPKDANIVVFDGQFAMDDPERHLKVSDAANIHKRLPFYQGIIGYGFLRCYAVNSNGAEQLLKLHREKEKMCFDGLLKQNYNVLPHLYTYIPRIMSLSYVSGVYSDIFVENRITDTGVAWKTASVETLYPKC